MTDAVPWVKWRFDRWRGDEGLRMCGLAARGLWADMLAIMHSGRPYGHLAINGKPPSPKQIASMVGMTTEKEVAALLRELEEAGVFSRSDDGLIFCRRMVRDNAARVLGKETGSRGGNPALKGNVPHADNGTSNPPPLSGGLTPPVNPEKREEKEKESKQASRGRANGNGTPPAWLDGVVPNPDDGRPTVNGYYLDYTFEKGCEYASIDTTKSRLDWKPVVEWLKDNIHPEVVHAAIKRCAERPGYKPPHSLAWFDRAVREQRAVA